MEKSSKGNKRDRNKKRIEEASKIEEVQQAINEEDSDKFILKKYLDTDIDTLNLSESKRMKPFIEEIRELIKTFKSENFDALTKIAETQVIKISLIYLFII